MGFKRSIFAALTLMTQTQTKIRILFSCPGRISPFLLSLLAASILLTVSASAQISLTTAVDLALRNSPRVRMATADVDKARAVLAEAHDVYIPTIVAGSGLGYAYGVPVTPPSVFNISSQSLVYNSSQRDYIRSATGGLEAANLALIDIRQQVAEDTTVTYMALDYDLERLKVMSTQRSYASRLTQIIEDRLAVGQDTQVELTRSRRNSAQFRLQDLQLQEDIDSRREHLARLTSLPATSLITIHSSIPPLPTVIASPPSYESPGVKAAYATAQAKQEQAFGDARKLWRPEIYFVAQYNRLASFNNLNLYYQNYNPNNIDIGIQINFPMVNSALRAKGRETSADAIHSRAEADLFRDQAAEGRVKLDHATQELQARVELANLDRELAQDQLDVVRLQLLSGVGDSNQQMTPKDEQNALIQERQRYLDLLDADFQLQESQINLMLRTGQLEDWLKAAAQSQPATPISVP
jgi:outer membrane protein TolC